MTFEIMSAMRNIIKDRTSTTAIAALVVYLFLIQIFIAGFSQGAMAGNAANPFNVICSSDGTLITLPDGSDRPSKSTPDYPCSLLCRLAATAIVAFPHTSESFCIEQFLTDGAPNHPSVPVLKSSSKGILAEPRAPPRAS